MFRQVFDQKVGLSVTTRTSLDKILAYVGEIAATVGVSPRTLKFEVQHVKFFIQYNDSTSANSAFLSL